MGHNFYLYLSPSTNRFLILPWDLDLSFGGFGAGAELSIDHPWRGQNRFLERLFQVAEFSKLYRTRMAEFNASICQPERLARQVDETAAVIRPAVLEESDAKLTRFDKSVAGEALPRGGGGGFGGPGGPGPRHGWSRRSTGGPGGQPIKTFAAARAKSVAAQLAGTSKGQQEGSGGPGGPGMGGPPGPGFGGPGGPGMGGPGGPRGFGPGNMLAPSFLNSMDQNKDGVISREESQRGLARWFAAWSGDAGTLTEEQLRTGINKDFAPQPGMMPAPACRHPSGESHAATPLPEYRLYQWTGHRARRSPRPPDGRLRLRHGDRRHLPLDPAQQSPRLHFPHDAGAAVRPHRHGYAGDRR